MDLKKEKIKKVLFFIFTIIFVTLTMIGGVLVIMGKVNNAGYAAIPSLFTMISSMLYRNSKKAIEENTQEKR